MERPTFVREKSNTTLINSFLGRDTSQEERTVVASRPQASPDDVAKEKRNASTEDPTSLRYKIIRFEQDDPENPQNWLTWRKWRAMSAAFTLTFVCAAAITSYKGIESMSNIGTTEFSGLCGSASLLIGVAIGPLFIAPLSERYGRKWTILTSFALFAILWLPVATATNVATVIAIRGVAGFVGSVGNTVVGGSVADCFSGKERGLPMTIFCVVIIANQALSAVWAGFVEHYAGWRWIAWVNVIMSFVGLAFVFVLLEETRADALLSKRAVKLTKETGIQYTTEFDIANSQRSMLAALKTSFLRPIIFLLTEPIVICWSLWIGLLWAQVFMLYAGVPILLDVYGFNSWQKGLAFLSVVIAAFFAFPVNWMQDFLYSRDQRKSPIGIAPPESRLYLCCIGGIGVPLSLFIFAATGRAAVHWFWPCFSLWLFTVFLIPIYITINTYLSDAYEQYASSALSSAAFLRNVLAGVLPLVTPAMYRNLGNVSASCLLGGMAALFLPIPFLLVFYGHKVRKASKVSRVIAEQQELRALQVQRKLESQQKQKHSA